MTTIYINTDGGSRGNPGPAAIGMVFFDSNGKVFLEDCDCIGVGTNNEAEYSAIVAALKMLHGSDWLSTNNSAGNEVICRLDSKLVVEQVNGNYKVKQPHLAKFVAEIHELINDLKVRISFTYVPREQNKEADALVNRALDGSSQK